MTTKENQGLAVLVKASRTSRRAGFSDVHGMVGGGMAAAEAVGETQRRMDWLRVPLADSGNEVLIRAANRVRPGSVESGNELDDRLAYIDAGWTSLKSDFARAVAAGTVTAAFHAAFLRDWTAWNEFFRANTGRWVVTRSAMQDAEQRRVQLEQWRNAFTAAGGTPSGVPTTAPAPGLLAQAAEAVGPSGIPETARAASNIAAAIGVVAVCGVVALVVIEGKSLMR